MRFIQLSRSSEDVHIVSNAGERASQKAGVITDTAALRREPGGEQADSHDA